MNRRPTLYESLKAFSSVLDQFERTEYNQSVENTLRQQFPRQNASEVNGKVNKNPKQVLSICGLSAVGKGTLIDKLDAMPAVRSRFRIDGRPQFFAEPNRRTTRSGKTRYLPLDQMYIEPHPEVIVYRWQFRTHQHIERLKEAFPNSEHRIIVLWRPWHQNAVNFTEHNYPGFKGKTVQENESTLRRQWRVDLSDKLGPDVALPSGIVLQIVDGSTDEYNTIDDWYSLLNR